MPDVVHRYLMKTLTNPQPPGFADFLRGTLALYQFAKQYAYNFKVDINSHPIFTMLDIPDENKAYIDISDNTIEVLPPIAYGNMASIYQNLFNKQESFNTLTNAYYTENSDMTPEYTFMKSLLQPNTTLRNYISTIKNSTGIDYTKPYVIIHVREGDNVLVYKKDIDQHIVDKVRHYINSIKSQNTTQILLIADSHQLKEKVSDLCQTTKTIPIHTGSLDSENVNEKLLTTLGEFFIMSGASHIYCINHWDGSGYSRICARIYSIGYQCLNL